MFIDDLLLKYDSDKISIGTLASHSSLQIVHGAKQEGFKTILVVLKNRLWFYKQFNHIIDKYIVVDHWRELCSEKVVNELQSENTVFIPHGSYVEYVGLDCALNLPIPIFGLRSLLQVEASQQAKMNLLKEAGIPIPRSYELGEEFDKLVIVKLPGAKGGKDYFIAKNRVK